MATATVEVKISDLPEVKAAMAELEGALKFLKRAGSGHRIVATNDLTSIQIAEFDAAGLMYVEPGGGLGWCLVPWDLTTPKDRQRETEYFNRKDAK